MRRRRNVLFLFVLISTSRELLSTPCRLDLQRSATERILDGLEKVADYVLENANLMNIDAAFGLVLGKAHMTYVRRNNQTPSEYVGRCFEIESKLSKALRETRKFLENTERNNLFMNTVLIVEAWIKNINFLKGQLDLKDITEKFKKVNTYDRYVHHLLKSPFNEKKSDDCITELLQQQNYCCKIHNCTVSRKCYGIMRLNGKKIVPAYGVTHSLLFLQVAKSQMCVINEFLFNQKTRTFCSYILWELYQNSKYGFVEALDDLLLEQITLCGYEGFSEFFTDEIIEHVIAIQHDSGCFAESDDLRRETHDYLNEKNTTAWPLSHSLMEISKRRKKRESNVLEDSCIDHTTGLGVSTFTTILRYLFRERTKSYSYEQNNY